MHFTYQPVTTILSHSGEVQHDGVSILPTRAAFVPRQSQICTVAMETDWWLSSPDREWQLWKLPGSHGSQGCYTHGKLNNLKKPWYWLFIVVMTLTLDSKWVRLPSELRQLLIWVDSEIWLLFTWLRVQLLKSGSRINLDSTCKEKRFEGTLLETQLVWTQLHFDSKIYSCSYRTTGNHILRFRQML